MKMEPAGGKHTLPLLGCVFMWVLFLAFSWQLKCKREAEFRSFEAERRQKEKLASSSTLGLQEAIEGALLASLAADTRYAGGLTGVPVPWKEDPRPAVSIELVPIRGGKFQMGNFPGWRIDDAPPHGVSVGDFSLARFEITNYQFAKFLNDYGSDTVQTGPDAGKKLLEQFDGDLS